MARIGVHVTHKIQNSLGCTTEMMNPFLVPRETPSIPPLGALPLNDPPHMESHRRTRGNLFPRMFALSGMDVILMEGTQFECCFFKGRSNGNHCFGGFHLEAMLLSGVWALSPCPFPLVHWRSRCVLDCKPPRFGDSAHQPPSPVAPEAKGLRHFHPCAIGVPALASPDDGGLQALCGHHRGEGEMSRGFGALDVDPRHRFCIVSPMDGRGLPSTHTSSDQSNVILASLVDGSTISLKA